MKNSISIKLFVFILILLINSNLKTNAQDNVFRLPSNIEKPQWYKDVNWNNPNVYTIDSLIHEYKLRPYKEKEERERQAERAFEEEGEFEEDPYITAYIRWRMEQYPYIQHDGFIKYDSNYYKNKYTQSKISRVENLGNWQPLGPIESFRDGVGDKTNSQANITSIAISASNPNIVVAGSESGVLYKSTDKGLNWTSINNDLPAVSTITAVGIDPVNSNIILYYNASGLFISNNGGSTFSRIDSYTYGEINRIVFNTVSNRILVASSNGIYYTADNGESWVLGSGSNTGQTFYDIAVKPGAPNTVYAIASQSISSNMLLYVSINGGTTFTNSTLSYNSQTITCEGARLAVSPANANYVYAVSLRKNSAPILIRSINSGSSWSVVTASTVTSFAGQNTTTGLGMSNGQGYYDLDLAVSPTNINQIITGTTTTFRSVDGGLNFSAIGGYFGSFGHKIHPDMQMIASFGNDTYITTDGGITYSSDFFSSDATVVNHGLEAAEYWGFGQGWDKDIVVGGRYHNGDGIMNENYGNGNAVYIGGGEDATGHVFHGKENTVGFRDMGTKVISDNINEGVRSAEIENSLWPQDDYYGYFSSKMMVDPRYSFIYYLGKDSSFWKSSNSGLSYISLKNFGSKVWRFDISRSNPNYMYVCTQSNGIQKTTDGGLTWSGLSLPAGVSYSYYNADIAINPANENEIVLCMANAVAANKVFKSVNGGATWSNITGSTLNNKSIAYILYHGNNGSMFAITKSIPCEIYYKDNSTDWTLFTAGLPQNLQVWGGCGIFFRDNKLRIATTRGIWETVINQDVLPYAQPMADKNKINCSKDTVSFNDYSILNYTASTWQWSFPGASFVSSTTIKNPKVLYSSPGNYNVTLTVTDANGRSHTKTMNNMIVFSDDYCKTDTVAGKSMIAKGTNTPVSIGTANINSNSFSMSCWFKPNGNQISFAQLISHDPYPGSSYGFGLGFTFSGYTPNLRLCYTDNLVNYSNSSNLIATDQKWNFVVLTYTPTGVNIYLNGKGQLVKNGNMPAINLSQSPFYINRDIHNQGGYLNGEIDEVKIYNYALSETEVREKMHLIPSIPLSENGLLKYCQFNFYEPTSSIAYELVDKSRITIPDQSFINNNSEVPVGTGIVQTLNNVNSGGLKDFTNLGLKLYLKPSATGITYPNGNLVGFRLNIPPYTKPDSRMLEPDSAWFIINNYGSNTNFTQPDSVRFERLNITPGTYSAGNFRLFKRLSVDHGNTWGAEIDSSDRFVYAPGTNNSSITFSTNNGITNFGQFSIVSNQNISPVPVSLLNFITSSDDLRSCIHLKWEIMETNENSRYEVERSTDGVHFNSIGAVSSTTSGSIETRREYYYDDYSINKKTKYYYRIKILKFNSSFNYSAVKTGYINSKATKAFAYPNPAKDYCKIDFIAYESNDTYVISLYDEKGSLVLKTAETITDAGLNSVLLNLSRLNSGSYLIKISNKSGVNVSTKLTVIK